MNSHSATTQRPLVLAITGASGAVYAVRLLELLLASGRQVHLVVSPSVAAVVRQEVQVDLAEEFSKDSSEPAARRAIGRLLEAGVAPRTSPNTHIHQSAREALDGGHLHWHQYQDYFTPIASGSYLTEAMVVCPCSGGTLSGIVRSNSGNLIERAAEVHLKERRKLIVVPRETPLSSFQLENMLRASQAGIVVLPAAPGWYHGASSLSDLVDFVVARILDQLGIPHQLMQPWQQEPQDF